MKRKLFNAALFGAILVAAPASTFVSCADYDADIENLQTQVNDLKSLVDQKEKALQTQIDALKAQDETLAQADAELKKAQENCKLECAAALAEAQAENAAARAQLQKAVEELIAQLEKKHGDDVASLLEANKELNAALATANGRIDAVEARMAAAEKAIEELGEVWAELDSVKNTLSAAITSLNNQLQDLDAAYKAADAKLQTQLDELTKSVAANKAAVEAEEAARKAAIDALTKAVNDNKAAADKAIAELQGKDTELANLITALTGRTADLEAYVKNNDKTLAEIKDQIAAVSSQVSDNTKSILDLAARIIDANLRIDEIQTAIELIVDAQKLVDAAQDAEMATLKDQLYGEDGDFAAVWAQFESVWSALTQHMNAFNDFCAATDVTLAEHSERMDNLQEQITNLNDLVDKAVTAISEKVLENEQRIDALEGGLAQLEEAYKAADAALYAQIGEELDGLWKDVNELVGYVLLSVTTDVKGLVLDPNSYYGGIQAIEGRRYYYNTYKFDADGMPLADKIGSDIWGPSVTATYHVNPSNAVLSTNVADYAFAEKDETLRAGAQKLVTGINKVTAEQGKVTLNFNIDESCCATYEWPSSYGESEHLYYDGDKEESYNTISVLALQYTYQNAADETATVTSDYAVMYLDPFYGINLLQEETHENVGDCINEGPATAEVFWNKTLDLSDIVYTGFGRTNRVTYHEGELPEGFKYNYTLVEEIDPLTGKKYTDGSTYFKLDGSVITPTYKGQAATIESVDHIALFRVDVCRDNAAKDVVETGYIKVTIVGEEIVKVLDPATVKDNTYSIICDPEDVVFEGHYSLEPLFDYIAEETKMTEAEVQEAYSFTGLYVKNEAGEWVANTIGSVEYPDGDEQGLVWTILNKEVTSDSFNPAVTAYACVRSNELVGGHYYYFYLPIKWQPAQKEVWGENGVETVTWNFTKVANQWQNNKVTRSQEIQLYPDLYKQGVAPYEYDIPTKAMTGMTVTLDHADKYANYAILNKLTDGHFIFVENPNPMGNVVYDQYNNEYELRVTDNGETLVADYIRGTETIATITPEGVIRLENNAVTKNIINGAAKEELDYGQTLCARVGYAVTSCGGETKVTSSFDVRFLEPLKVTYAPLADIEDTEGVAGLVRRAVELESIIAFNGYNFDDHAEYHDVFAVEGYQVADMDEWTTNYNGGTIEDGQSTPVTYLHECEISNNFGLIADDNVVTFQCNTAILNCFDVRIPVYFNYVWGPAVEYVYLHVNHTPGM